MVRVVALAAFLLSSLAYLRPATAQDAGPPSELGEHGVETAPVEIDGAALFPVRGIRSFPAATRAKAIADRIRGIATDPSIPADSITLSESPIGTQISAGDRPVMTVLESDAALEGVRPQVLASLYRDKIRQAVEQYRHQRTASFLGNRALYAAIFTAATVFLLLVIRWLHRRLLTLLESRYRERLRSLQVQRLEIVHAERVWATVCRLVGSARFVLVALLLFFYLEWTLRLFPWTRFLANQLFQYIADPLRTIAAGAVAQIPNLFFLAIAVFITRYLLKAIRLFFLGIQNRQVTFANFDPEWAMPTYRLVRILVIALVLVVMYPYIPGADTAAFKGVTVFIGILFSLGSSSAISSVIAGYTMTYRRAFRVGDRVKIGDDIGDVTYMRLLVTHLATVKNEEVVIPNSLILSSSVVNYSSLAREKGLILHTSVTIGYDAPWRQVHAMLLRAAERTEGILREPKPFVLQRSLDDFYVNYELNAYTDRPVEMLVIYSRLHQNVQDEFNEHGVQIMSPHYISDPAQAKVVPRQQWFAPPAQPNGG